MKAGILTFHYAHHYGAQLQAYALMRAIQLLGVDCEIINYVRKDNIEGSSLFKKGLSLRSVLSNLDTLLHYRSLKKRHDRFDSFVSDEMKLSGKFYGSYRELCDDPPAYDVYVCGSDQVWNPLIFSEKTFDPAFFADFAKGGRRVAYAPSFGISSIPEDKRDEIAGYLAKFDCLSAREKQGEKIIREISGREAVTVLDPTLLLPAGEWARLAAAPGSTRENDPETDGGDLPEANRNVLPEADRSGSPGAGRSASPETDGGDLPEANRSVFPEAARIVPAKAGGDDAPGVNGENRPEEGRDDTPEAGGYILCYFITDARKYADFVGLAAEKYGLPVVSLCGSRRVVPQTKRKRLDCGPREFLGLFRGASVVCTDSFHGTVFSLIFEKEFYSFEASKDPSRAVGSRQHNLLETTGLLSRLYHISSGTDGFRRLLDEQAGAIDYREVREILRKKREGSLSYLKNALVPGGGMDASSEENAGVSEIAQTEDQI